MRICVPLVAGFLLAMPAVAPAQTQDDQNGCQNDVFALCGEFIPDRDRIVSCLRHKWREVSPECRKTMASYGKRLKERAARRGGSGDQCNSAAC